MNKREFLARSLSEHRDALDRREYSSRELTEAYLEQIEEKNEEINAFVSVCAERALAEADEADARRRTGEVRSFLDGIPYAAKDNISVSGLTLSCGSKMLRDYVAVYDASVISLLAKKGAVLLGKTNLDEFAMGTGTESSCFGRTKNPLEYSRVAGGSSGGSAAAVAANMAAFALGSDTGGSVRQPAAFCGLVGMRPTYSALSRYGLVGFAPSLDSIGILARGVRDCRQVLENIAVRDPLDATSHGLQSISTTKTRSDLKNKKFAIIKELGSVELSAEVLDAFDKSVIRAKELGAQVLELSIPSANSAYAAYYTISSAEASSNLSRFDGVRYGYRAKNAESLDEVYTDSRSQGFGDEVKRRILFGALSLSEGFRDELYMRAVSARTRLRAELEEALIDVDAFIIPTASTPAYFAGTRDNGLFDAYVKDDLLCALASLAGLPSVSLPYECEGGLSVGIQLVGRRYEDRELLNIASLFVDGEESL